MDNNISVKPEDQGKNMRLAFEYIQQIFRETSQLMKQLDSYMGKDWIPTYGNRTTRGVTSHIDEPDEWLVQAVFRIYDSTKEPTIKKGITVAYWGNELEVPMLIAGKLIYKADTSTGKPIKDNHWDLWDNWFEDGSEFYKTDGTIYTLKNDGKLDYIQGATVFVIPLVSIQSEKDIKTKIYDKLITL